MKEQLALLRELQRIDLELDQITQSKEQIQGRLDENKVVLDQLDGQLDARKAELGEIRALRNQKQDEQAEIGENLKERKKRLLNVGSTKEYNAVEKEIETLKGSSEQLDEELLNLAEVIENTTNAIDENETKVNMLRDDIQKEDASVQDQLTTYDKQIKSLNNRTDKARGDVSKRVLYKYDFIRSRRPGLAICGAKDGHCTACYMSLPPQLFIQIQRGDTLETCPSCQRILYYWEESPEDFEREKERHQANQSED